MSEYANTTSTMDLYANLCDDYELTIGFVVRDVGDSVLCDSVVSLHGTLITTQEGSALQAALLSKPLEACRARF